MSLASGDLTTLTTAQTYLSAAPSSAVLSGLITRVSRAILNELNRPFILPKTYIEQFNGTGTTQLVLPNWPVLSLASLAVSGASIDEAIQASEASYSLPYGWRFQPWNGVPPGEPAIIGLNGGAWFFYGTQNVVATYVAGYRVTDEAAIIPNDMIYQVDPVEPYGSWASDEGVTYANGTALVAISSGTPTVGQYLPPAPDASTPRTKYTFAAADATQAVLISYGFIPGDLEQIALELIADRSAYRTRPGVRSKSIANQESVSYDGSGLANFARDLAPYKSVLPPAMGGYV